MTTQTELLDGQIEELEEVSTELNVDLAIVIPSETNPHDINTSAGLYIKLRELKRIVEEMDKAVNGALEKVQFELVETMDRQNITSMNTKWGKRIGVSSQIWASIPPNNKDLAFKWLRNNGKGAIITETVNAGTLSAFVRAEMADNREVPDINTDADDGIFNVYNKQIVSMTTIK